MCLPTLQKISTFETGVTALPADLMKVAIDEDAITDIKGMHHKQEDDAVKHGGNGALEDEAEGHNGGGHSCP